jgi:hypothetical protein
VEIEPETPAGYFNYFAERNKVYDEPSGYRKNRSQVLGCANHSN